MNRKVRMVQIGYGKMAHCIVENMVESGADVLAVFDRNPGKIGTYAEYANVQIESIDTLGERLGVLMPDCAIVATQSLMRNVEDIILTCVSHGVSVVTTCDEALYPWTSSPAITKRIDKVARANACTVSSSGFPDLAYCSMVAATCGAAHKINKISGCASYNVDDYGVALAEHHGVGLSKEEFENTIGKLNNISDEELNKMINEGTFTPIPMWNTNSWLCTKLGLTIRRQRQINTPIFADHDIESATMGRVLKRGETIGMSAKAITETNEGILIETESVGKVYDKGEKDINDWCIHGEPDIHVMNDHIDNEGMICALIVSRIVDTLNADAGFVTSNHFAPATFLLRPINEYITTID